MINRSNEQKLIDIMFEIALTMHDPKYRKTFNKLSREEVAQWVVDQLNGCGFKTVPVGSSWGVLVEIN